MVLDILFKITQFVLLIIFVIYISDFRRKKGMVPLIDKKITLFMKVFYFIPILIYVYALINLEVYFGLDYFAVLLGLIGVFVVIKAKTDLGKYHTWAGYHKKGTKIITDGVYAYVRHPLYSGIFVFIFGVILTMVLHLEWLLRIGGIFLLIIGMAFLVNSAKKEEEILEKEFGGQYLKYKERVHAFVPIRKF